MSSKCQRLKLSEILFCTPGRKQTLTQQLQLAVIHAISLKHVCVKGFLARPLLITSTVDVLSQCNNRFLLCNFACQILIAITIAQHSSSFIVSLCRLITAAGKFAVKKLAICPSTATCQATICTEHPVRRAPPLFREHCNSIEPTNKGAPPVQISTEFSRYWTYTTRALKGCNKLENSSEKNPASSDRGTNKI